MLRVFVLAIMLVTAPDVARADWRVATSTHFQIYSDTSEETLREATLKLERFHRVVRWATSVDGEDPPVKFRVFLMGNQRELQDTMIGSGTGVAGYYTIGGRGPVAFGLRRDPRDWKGMGAQEVLFHEYSHHLMFQYFPAAYPAWYREGFAEFYGQTRINDDDVVEIGHPALNRYMAFGEWVPLSRLLTARGSADLGMHAYAIYSQGWLLVHYLVNSKEREGQLQHYLNAINHGASFEQAMDSAFGEGARELNSELRSYSRKRVLTATRIPFKPMDASGIAVRALSPAEEALIDLEIQFSRGLPEREATDFADEVREVVERFPADPYALSMVVEAERAVRNFAGAEAAVERWLAVQPNAPEALMHKAELQIQGLLAAGSSEEASWEAARNLIVEAVRGDPNNPRILVAYYDSFTAAGELPPPGAQNGLYHAFELTPQTSDIRYKLALDFEQRGMIGEAIAVIKPAAYALHDENEESEREERRRERLEEKYRGVDHRERETAREMLARLESKLASAGTASGAAN